MKYTLIFDFDGTLHETARVYIPAFRKAAAFLEENGFSVPFLPDEQVTKYLGVNVIDMWNDFQPNLPRIWQQKGAAVLSAALSEAVRSPRARLYDGVPEVLDALRDSGHKMILLSNCREEYLHDIRARFSLDRWLCDYYCCQAYDYAAKEEIFPAIAVAHPGPWVMIGDRASDKQVSIVHQIPFLGCSYGYGTPEELSGATRLLQSPRELPAAIASLEQA